MLQSRQQLRQHNALVINQPPTPPLLPPLLPPPSPCGVVPQAVELGPHSNHGGPLLTLLRSTQLSPATFNAWLDTCFMRRQVGRVYHLPQDIPLAPTRCAPLPLDRHLEFTVLWLCIATRRGAACTLASSVSPTATYPAFPDVPPTPLCYLAPP